MDPAVHPADASSEIPANPVNPVNPTASAHRQPSARDEADWGGLDILVQCYWREIAEPHGLVTWPAVADLDVDVASRHYQIGDENWHVAKLEMPFLQQSLFVSVDRRSCVGIRHIGGVWLEGAGERTTLTHAMFARLLVEELALRFQRPVNEDLIVQMGCSVDVTAKIFAERPATIVNLKSPAEAYWQSEQSLVFGHPFHPTPKARSGLSTDDLMRYSPELGAEFALHYFAVRNEYLVQDSVGEESAAAMVASEIPSELLPGAGWSLIPAHPWQAGYLRRLAGVQAAEAADQLRYLGAHGRLFRPTASVRTLHAKDSRFFYKMALSFRITNCLRRNAVPELAASLRVNRMMASVRPELNESFPSFRTLDEVGYLSVSLPDAPAEEQALISDGFGMMLRRNLDIGIDSGEVCMVAASLFGNAAQGRDLLRQLITESAGLTGSITASLTPRLVVSWFDAYLGQLLPPLLYLYSKVGIMFEPHLQNIVVGFRNGCPSSLYLRDFENARLVSSRVSADVASRLTDSEQRELNYSEIKSWKRFAYCLFSNHVVEAIRQLSFARPELEPLLWKSVRYHVSEFLRLHGEPADVPMLAELLAGTPLPAKTNLITRVLVGKDAEASYVSLGNPWVDVKEPELDLNASAQDRSRAQMTVHG